jgi:S-DNA-T family DNA segregation ATPase FtsK/SpoIIIE
MNEEFRDVVREHQSLARSAAREVDAARKSIGNGEDLFYEEGEKPVVPENPYNEILIKYKNPPLDILTPADPKDALDANDEELKMKGRLLRDKLATFGVDIENITVTPGPVVTLYEFTPAEGVKVSRVENLTDDIALAMKARGIRIIAPIPGRGTIGVEIPNDDPKMVVIRSLFESESFKNTKMNLPLALGKTISGDVYIDDLNKMPHLLIAGATGSGKSVGVNGIIASLLYAKSPRDVKFVIVDPKKIELSLYKKLRKHYLIVSPEAGEDIVTTPQYAVLALKAVELEMERRYDKLAKAAVRSLADYNIKVAQGKLRSTQEEQHYHLPYIVVIIDELADLMITAAREIEEPICRIAQMARAVGIHLILATQRPSVDVITGVIKANFPARMAYQVATRVDSRTILDSMGAEQLLGNGDMLYQPSGTPKPIRLQSPFISTDEVEAMIDSIAMQDGDKLSYSRPWTLPSLKTKDSRGGSTMEDEDSRDELFEEAARIIVRHQQGSVSLLQRRLKVGYSRAARIVDELEQAAIVGPFDGSKARQVLCENEEELELVLEGLR